MEGYLFDSYNRNPLLAFDHVAPRFAAGVIRVFVSPLTGVNSVGDAMTPRANGGGRHDEWVPRRREGSGGRRAVRPGGGVDPRGAGGVYCPAPRSASRAFGRAVVCGPGAKRRWRGSGLSGGLRPFMGRPRAGAAHLQALPGAAPARVSRSRPLTRRHPPRAAREAGATAASRRYRDGTLSLIRTSGTITPRVTVRCPFSIAPHLPSSGR